MRHTQEPIENCGVSPGVLPWRALNSTEELLLAVFRRAPHTAATSPARRNSILLKHRIVKKA